MSKIESGKRDPRFFFIERIVEVMGLTVLIVAKAMVPELTRYIAHATGVHERAFRRAQAHTPKS